MGNGLQKESGQPSQADPVPASRGGTWPASPPDLALARLVIAIEAAAVASLADRLDSQFTRAAELVFACRGTVVTAGVGKAGLVAQKISATLASTGTPSHFLHPVEAVHGDLGRLRPDDLLLALSQSGQTEEILRLVNVVKKLKVPLVSVTASADSMLARHSDVVLAIGELAEACPLGLAPTASTTAMLALGDALALVVMRMRRFTPAQFAEFHPGGQIGRLLMKVEEAMSVRAGENLPLFEEALTVRQIQHQLAANFKRPPGAVLLTDAQGRLSGIFTDADLRRLIGRLLDERDLALLDAPMERVMIRNPQRVRVGQLTSAAMAIFSEWRIDELPVVDEQDRPVGLLDVQDIVPLKLL